MPQSEIVTTILASSVAGIIPGAILGMSHYATKPLKWGNVKRYAYGCTWVFLGGTGFTIFYTEITGGKSGYAIVFGWWLILAICGGIVALAYRYDEKESIARQKEAEVISQNERIEASSADTNS